MIIIYALIAALVFYLVSRIHKNRAAIVYRWHWILSLRIVSSWRVSALEAEIARLDNALAEAQRLLEVTNKTGKTGQLSLPIDPKSGRQQRIVAPSGNGVSYAVSRADLVKSQNGMIKVEREYWRDNQNGKKQKREFQTLWIDPADANLSDKWVKDSQNRWFVDRELAVVEVVNN